MATCGPDVLSSHGYIEIIGTPVASVGGKLFSQNRRVAQDPLQQPGSGGTFWGTWLCGKSEPPFKQYVASKIRIPQPHNFAHSVHVVTVREWPEREGHGRASIARQFGHLTGQTNTGSLAAGAECADAGGVIRRVTAVAGTADARRPARRANTRPRVLPGARFPDNATLSGAVVGMLRG